MQRLIDPKTLARVKDMPLVAKTVADGFLHGQQSSNQRGLGIEFSQYRSYEPGDEPGRIDWKLFARSDRYFIREAERESDITVWLVVDASASMKASSELIQKEGWNKLDYARHLAATLAYIGQKQGDSVGLLGLSTDQLSFLPPGAGERHWHRIMAELFKLKAGNVFPNTNLLNQYTTRLQRPGLVFLLSDFYQQHNEINDFLAQVSHNHNDVTALQLQTVDELKFPYKGPIRFKDLETHEEVFVSSGGIKQDYFNALYEHQQTLKTQLAALRVDLCSINIDQPMDEVLFNYLKARQKVVR
ncbi:MAG: DUF58 domain-containing protein [Algicola sp.]|nr:DUF58 domain-containing protein [Algicola sp.]